MAWVLYSSAGTTSVDPDHENVLVTEVAEKMDDRLKVPLLEEEKDPGDKMKK